MKRSASPTERALRRLRAQFPTASAAFRQTLEIAARAAGSEASVLITGEPGTGKTRLARAIHQISSAKGPLVEVACASIPEELFEAELFGYEKGAFTDAFERRRGLVEQAHEGTLHLDEIADLPLQVQPKLLRFVQDGTFRRLSGVAELRVRTRLISSTSVAPTGERIRTDLLYRLDVIRLHIPPLRDRVGDVARLAQTILEEETGNERSVALSPGAIEAIERHPWPGNVRELRNAIRRALIGSDTDTLSVDDLSLQVSEPQLAAHAATGRWTLEDLERAYIAEILRATGRNYSQAATILGINRKTLLEKRRKYGLDE